MIGGWLPRTLVAPKPVPRVTPVRKPSAPYRHCGFIMLQNSNRIDVPLD